jgi:hypothetical protein
MTDIEERVRTTLAHHAGEAPIGGSVLPRVRHESSRRRRRHRWMLAASLATAVALVALSVPVIADRLGAPVPPSTPGRPAPSVSLVAGTSVDVTFPFAMPSLFLESAPVASLVAGRPTLTYASTADTDTKITVVPVTEPPPSDSKPFLGGNLKTIMSVRGISVGKRLVAWWPLSPGRWVEINIPTTVALSILQKYASLFVPGRATAPGPLAFALVPAGYTVDNIDAGRVTFCPPGVPASPGTSGKIVVAIGATPAPIEWRSVTVGGRPGRIGTGDGDTEVLTALDDGRMLSVQVPTALGMTTVDLIRFAAGVHAR